MIDILKLLWNIYESIAIIGFPILVMAIIKSESKR